MEPVKTEATAPLAAERPGERSKCRPPMSDPIHHDGTAGVLLGQHSRVGQGAGGAPAKAQCETETPPALVTGRQLREGGDRESPRCPHSLCCRAKFVLASSRASGEGGSQGCVTTARQEGGHQGRCPRKEGCQTAAPAKKVSKKASPPKEFSLTLKVRTTIVPLYGGGEEDPRVLASSNLFDVKYAACL